MAKISFPVLYDTSIYEGEELIEHRNGYFNYETNIFEIPQKDLTIIQKANKFRNDLDIIESVGFKVI